MTRRLVLPAIVLLIAGAIWWLDPGERPNDEPATPDTPAAVAPDRSSESADRFVKEASIARWEKVEDFDKDLALFEFVFWEPADTTSLRKLIRETDQVKGKSVLEIGTGSGLISLCCLKAGARPVVATDINQSAVRNAVYNAKELGLLENFSVRLVPQDDSHAWSVVKDDERFDLIISNPPWEDAKPKQVSDFALYDTNFALLKSLLAGLKSHLKPGGRCLLAYGCVTAIKEIDRIAAMHGLQTKRLDARNLDELDELFLPGMLIEVTPL